MRADRVFRPRGRRPRTPARGGCPLTPRSFFHGQRGSPPVTPPTTTVPTHNDAGYRWRWTSTSHSGHTSRGGPRKTVVPPNNRISASLHSSFRHSRPTAARPSTTLGQPPFVPPRLSANRLSSFRRSRPTFARPSTAPGQPP